MKIILKSMVYLITFIFITLMVVPTIVFAETPTNILNDKRIVWSGRTVSYNNGIALGWSMSSLTFNMKGESAKIKLTTGNDAPYSPFVGIYINDEFKEKIRVKKGDNWYNIAEGLESDKVTKISVVKLNEQWMCATVTGLTIDGELQTSPKKSPYLLEVVGDSITATYGVLSNESASTDEDVTTDASVGYANILSKKMEYELQIVAASGKGVFKNVDGTTTNTMREWYDRGLPAVSKSYWNHYKKHPDLIIVNLGTNDANANVSEKDIGEAVQEMLSHITKVHPNAKVAWVYGIINEDLLEPIKNAVETFGKTNGNVYFIALPNQSELSSKPTGLLSHPNTEVHEKTADYLYTKLDELGLIKKVPKEEVSSPDKTESVSASVSSDTESVKLGIGSRVESVTDSTDSDVQTSVTSSTVSQTDGQLDKDGNEENTGKKSNKESKIILFAIIGLVELLLLVGFLLLFIKKHKNIKR